MRAIKLLLLSLLLAGTAAAQSKTGTTIGQVLLIEPSARVAAMGNAGTTTFSEVTAAFFNPGALGHMAQSDAQFTYSRWLVDVTYNYAAAALRFGGSNTLLLTLASLDSGEMLVRTEGQPLGTGERFDATFLTLGLGYSRRFTDRFSAGIQVNYLQEKIWHSTLNALSLNFGVLYQLPFRAYIGASLSNFGTRGVYSGRDLFVDLDLDPDRFGDNSRLGAALRNDDYPLPILFRVGLGYPIAFGANSQLLLVADAFQPSDNTNSVSFGGEWMFRDLLALRGGYQHLFQEDSETGPTAGAGLKFDFAGYVARFDYAWNDYNRLGHTQRFTFGFSF